MDTGTDFGWVRHLHQRPADNGPPSPAPLAAAAAATPAAPAAPTPSSSPRRRGRFEASRPRISRACDRCKKRKIRCTGTQPCVTCSKAAITCAYATPYNRGRRPPSPRILLSEDAASQQQQRRHHQQSEPEPELIHNDGRGGLSRPSSSGMATAESMSRASPEPITDLQGHYLGPASGVSFLARVHKRLHQTTHASSNFTFGDAPLPDYDPTPSVMISLEEMMQLLQKFFEFTMPIDRLFHRPTIEKWLREFHETMGSMKKNEDASARRAVLWMVFAMAKEHQSPEPITISDDRSILYFLAADFQLSKKRGVVSLASVQARLCQCFWLLSRSRMNHCWDIFGSAARLALVLGLHRKPPPTSTSTRSLVDLECGRRTFWSAYCLDNHLSITLGRPRIFHDDDIDQDFPSGVDDDELFTQQPLLRNSHVYSTMLAPVAYFKLYRIMSIVLRDLYSIHPASIVRQYEFAERYSQVLREWRDDIPRFLDADSNGSTPLIPIFQRQRDVLNLAYWHAMVLTHRPLLLRNFAKVQCGNHETTTHDPHVERSVRECLDAAMHIVDRMDDMFQSGLMFRSFWGTCYFGFSAAVVLYVYAIQQSFSSSVNTYQTYLDAAIRCQNQLSRITGSGSLVARYCAVLEELRVEALRRIESEPNLPPVNQESTTAVGTEIMSEENINGILYAPVVYPDVYGQSGQKANQSAIS